MAKNNETLPNLNSVNFVLYVPDNMPPEQLQKMEYDVAMLQGELNKQPPEGLPEGTKINIVVFKESGEYDYDYEAYKNEQYALGNIID